MERLQVEGHAMLATLRRLLEDRFVRAFNYVNGPCLG